MLRQIALLLFSCALLPAQVERAAIVGNVTDKSGAAMPGVAVLVTNEATNTSTLLASDESGGYTAVNLIPGNYKVTASRSGFRPVTGNSSARSIDRCAWRRRKWWTGWCAISNWSLGPRTC